VHHIRSLRTMRTSRLAGAGAVLMALAGCAVGAPTAGGVSSQTSATAAAGTFAIDQDFPDPDVMRVGDTYYAYATNTGTTNVQVATSKDLTSWSVLAEDALPQLPVWALAGKTWAPDVSVLSPGHYVMYFVTANLNPSMQCVGVATSTSPTGPFVSAGDTALVCPADQGGAIDPATFVADDGTGYVVWKNDGNCCGLDTWLQIAPLSPDGMHLTGAATKLIRQTAPWEGNVIEAPTLVKRHGSYFLFYSANDYSGGGYAIGYATASSPLGPYVKHGDPLLTTISSGGRYTGPGGQDIVQAPDGSDRLVFHSWDSSLTYRGMNVAPLVWKDGQPVVAGGQ
jgi:arabinan endo-1,5-alpha-L-arabinosidase